MAGEYEIDANTSESPNIVTIILDCARAKSFGYTGGTPSAKTPVIDSLREKGTAFTRAVAPSNWTVPSHFSIFTGMYPNLHGVRSFQRSGGGYETTASYLRRSGYDTILLSENPLVGVIGSEKGFSIRQSGLEPDRAEDGSVLRGLFGLFEKIRPQTLVGPVSRFPPLIVPLNLIYRNQEIAYKRRVCTGAFIDFFARWYDSRPAMRPFYAVFNFVDTHPPHEIITNSEPINPLERMYLYTPRFFLLASPAIRERVRWDILLRSYLRGIEAADQKVGRLAKLLETKGEIDRTLLIVTSDHGESFGECGFFYHGTGAPDSVARVPLVVVPPKNHRAVKRVDRWVSLCAIDSWVKASATGLPPYDDRGVAPAPYGPPAPAPSVVYCEGAPASDSIRSLKGFGSALVWNQRLLAAYQGDSKFQLNVDTGEIVRWSLKTDPDYDSPERLSNALSAQVRSDVFAVYEATDLASSTARRSSGTQAPIDIGKRLRSWGYD